MKNKFKNQKGIAGLGIALILLVTGLGLQQSGLVKHNQDTQRMELNKELLKNGVADYSGMNE